MQRPASQMEGLLGGRAPPRSPSGPPPASHGHRPHGARSRLDAAGSDTIEPCESPSSGQAGLYLETRAGSILCDPWFNPAYFGSWFPFPANDGIDPARSAARLPLRQPPPPRPLRPRLAERALLEGRDGHPARLPGRRPPPRAPRPRLPALRRDGRLRAVRPRRRPADHGHGPPGPDRRAARRLGPARRRRRGPPPEHERLAPDRPGQAPGVRPARPALPPVLRRDLVPDGLRVPAQGEDHPGPQEAGRPARPGRSATSRSSPRRSSCRAPARRASSTTTCSPRTTSTATRPTSSPTRPSSSTT